MASFTADWSNAATPVNAVSVTNGSSQNADIDLDANGYYVISAQVVFDISSGSPSGDLLIEVLTSVDAGSNIDTEVVQRLAINFTATGNKKKPVRFFGSPWCRIKCTNNTGVTGTLTVRYSGLKQASA